jgi:hypothetical protein
MENVGIFYGHWDYFTAMCYIFRTFGNFAVNWYILPGFGTLHKEKSGNPGLESRMRVNVVNQFRP